MGATVRFGSRTVELTHPDKVLFPDAGYTKRDLFHYYRGVADSMLRHLRDRPLTLQRFPEGIAEEGFYQKEAPDSLPSWLERVTVPLREGGSQDQVTVDSPAGLALLAQLGTVTLHVWSSRRPHLDAPDRLVFDLDPADDTPFSALRRSARELADRLRDRGLTPFPMLTGSTGIHVWAPIRADRPFDQVRAFARGVANDLVADRPDELTTETRKAKREGRIFVDVARNARGQTAVAPYSVRARPGAPVAAPLEWDELGRVDGSGHYSIRSMLRRLAQRDDPWSGMGRHAASVPDVEPGD